MLSVLYDGKCSICRKEIEYYQKIAPSERFQWLDITTNTEVLANYHLKMSEVLFELHTVDSSGQMYKGVDSFILIWQELKYWRLLAKFASLPLIKPMLKRLYIVFAERRFKRLSHCQLSLQNEP